MKIKIEEDKPIPEDDSAVMRLYLLWAPNVELVMRYDGDEPLCHVSRGEDGAWRLAFSVRRGKKRQRHFADVEPYLVHLTGKETPKPTPGRWVMILLGTHGGRGAWDLPSSIHAPDQFHGFVTLVGVPSPAPWEPGFAEASVEPASGTER